MKFKLPKDWEKVSLGEVITLNYGKALTKKNRIPGEIPVYSSAGKTGSHNESLVNGPGIIVGRKGTIGTVYYEEDDFFCIDTAYYIEEGKDYELEYLYYLIKTLGLENLNTDTAVPGLNRNRAYSVNVSLPPLSEQKVISETLSSLDNKIELNNKINKNLEQQAQEIFKHWFVDFEFPDENGKPYKSSGGEMVESDLEMIPKGWDIKSLGKVAEFLNGIAIAKYKPETKSDETLPAIKIREMRQGFTDDSSDRCLISVDEKYIINNYDMLFAWSGSLLIDTWVGGKAILNQHLFKVTSPEYDQWFYYYWSKYFLDEFIEIAKNKATTMGHINRSHLSEAKVLVPNEKTYKEMGSIFSNILDLKMKNKKQNRTLSQLRDTLLPKLMSGEIRIPLD